MLSIMTMLMPAAADARETRELSASRSAESTKDLGDGKRKDLKTVARHAFPSTLRAAERAQDSPKVDPKTESLESRLAPPSRWRPADEHRELPVRSADDRPFSDDGLSDEEKGGGQLAMTSSGGRDENTGSGPASIILTMADQSGGLMCQDRSECLPAFQFDGTNPELLTWLRGEDWKAGGMSSLESESTPDGCRMMAPSDSIGLSGLLTPASSPLAATLLEPTAHGGAARKQDEKGAGFLPTRPSALPGEVGLGGPSAGSNQERYPVTADNIAWPLVDQPGAPFRIGQHTQESTLSHNHVAIDMSGDPWRSAVSYGGLDKVAEAPAPARRSAFFLGPTMSLHAVSSPSAVPGGEEPSVDPSILFSNLVTPSEEESQVAQQELTEQDEETSRAELRNQRSPGISPASGQEQVMRLIQRPEMGPVTGMSPQPTPAEGGHRGDGAPTWRAATVGFAQETTGTVLPRAVAFEVSGPELGHVNVRVAVKNEMVHAHMVSDRPEVAAYLVTGHDRLQSALQASGLEMGYFRVDVDRHGANRSFHHHTSPEQGGAWQSAQRTPESLRDQADWSISRPDRLDTGLLHVVA